MEQATNQSYYSFCCDYIQEYGEEDMIAVGYEELYKIYEQYGKQ